jgi:hypothetical protein
MKPIGIKYILLGWIWYPLLLVIVPLEQYFVMIKLGAILPFAR